MTLTFEEIVWVLHMHMTLDLVPIDICANFFFQNPLRDEKDIEGWGLSAVNDKLKGWKFLDRT